MNKKEIFYDLNWMLSLFGTAIGAGILFLPIRAGEGGIWPIFLMIILIFPMTWLSHRALSRFVLSSSNPNNDITNVVTEHFGFVGGRIITVLYFFAIYPICLAYGVGITNTIASFLVNQLQIVNVPRPLIAIISISLMMWVMISGKEFMLKATQFIVYPLILSLFIFSIYLIPYWNFETISYVPSKGEFLKALWLSLPVLVFSFNHSPAISSFSLDLNKKYPDRVEQKLNSILFWTAVSLVVFAMFFVISFALTLTPAQFLQAREANIPILSFFANNVSSSPLITYIGPLIAFTAIVSSFFGHYLGAFEGLVGIIKQVFSKKEADEKKVNIFSAAFIYVTMIIVAIINPSILGFIEELGGPIIAMILFIMPIYAIYRVQSMKKYAAPVADAFIMIMGLLTLSSIIYKFL